MCSTLQERKVCKFCESRSNCKEVINSVIIALCEILFQN